VSLDKFLAQVERWTKSCVEYAADVLKINTTDATLEYFAYNNIQLAMDEIVADIRAHGRFVRLVILKLRRAGISTWYASRVFWLTNMNPNTYALMVAHDPDAAETIFTMQKRFYANLPPKIKPQVLYDNRKVLEFNTKSRVGGLDSAIRVAAAGKENLGSSQLVNFAHFCMHPDTPVLVSDGRQKRIADVCVGDRVVTHTGATAEVNAVSRTSHEDMPSGRRTVVVRPWSGQPIACSPEHRIFTDRGFIQAQHLQPSDKLSMPVRKITSIRSVLDVDVASRARPGRGCDHRRGPDKFELTLETGFLVGYYLAEGCASNHTPNGWARITLAHAPGEEPYAIRAFNAARPWVKSGAPVFKTSNKSKTCSVDINSVTLASLVVREFGRTDSKHVPDWVFTAGEEFCRGVLLGYLSGDGSKTCSAAPALQATSIRESLAYQIRDLAVSLGYGWGAVREKVAFVDGRGWDCKRAWTVSWSGEAARRLRHDLGLPKLPDRQERPWVEKYEVRDDIVWMKIHSITEGASSEFVDISVDHEDHSFRTAHFSVSNSEFAKWPGSILKAIMTSLMPCIPKTAESEIVVESTAFGVGNAFHKLYVQARYKYKMYLNSVGDLAWECKIDLKAPPGNTWSAVFIPCYVFEKNQLAVTAWEAQTGMKFERTAEEILICELYLKGCTDARANKFLCWRRMSIADDFNGDVSRFNQENPLSDLEAFISSGEPAFDTHRISARLDAAPLPIARYEIDPVTGQFMLSPTGRLWVWEEPKAGEAYAIPADIAKGIVVEGRESQDDFLSDSAHDFSVCSVKHQLTRREVAQWHGKIDPDQFGRLLVFLAIRYNMAWIIPESNNHGHTTIAAIVGKLPGQMRYKKVFSEVMERPPNKPRREWGFNTRGGPDGGVRFDAVNALIALERDGKDGIKSSRTLEEMLSYKRNAKGKYEAEEGHHDDCVTVEFIGAAAIPLLPLPANAPRKAPLAVPGGAPSAPAGRGGQAQIHPGFT